MPQPIDRAPLDAAYLGIKPILMQPPKPFKGAHNDIERFVGDCLTYFEAFAMYFTLDSQTVPFAASYFEGPAKEWWVYKRPDYWANDDNDPVSARFRYPTWPEFVNDITTQFRDPAIEIVHECKMFEVRMGKNPASQFFYELEKKAKLAGHPALSARILHERCQLTHSENTSGVSVENIQFLRIIWYISQQPNS
ncbi:uncharacterized protein ARMOST_04132 [Armillaria ostoyae]|uniref:Retrotransposon gag domain-containing protein n=1 Tax=Armillaria ostoyae TaxID=47428 RepID=A0A284QWH2_ARMOS|nr:uncharacterized protein ARMOST_04132 [Armillaria ostoyae]